MTELSIWNEKQGGEFLGFWGSHWCIWTRVFKNEAETASHCSWHPGIERSQHWLVRRTFFVATSGTS